jgi:hypothetical protein
LLRLFPALLLAACQPQARRVLLVDFASSEPLSLEATAEPWHAAGYRVEYRRFYPHLTRQDLARYRTVIVLGGREPEGRTDALTLGDLAILNEWLRRDGVVVLGYSSDTAGRGDRWIMNQWLAAQGAGLAIGTQTLESPGVPLPRSALDNAGFAPFPAGRNRVLLVRDQTQTLARSVTSVQGERPAIVGASRVRDGLIVVASRAVLAAGNADLRTRDFLVALARWTRRPAEWASVAPGVSAGFLSLANAPRPVATHPPLLKPPAGAALIPMPEPLPSTRSDSGLTVPNWIARQGMRVLWSRFAAYTTDSLLRFVDAGALNTLVSVIPQATLADSFSTRNLWKNTIERLQSTSLRWFPATALVELPNQSADEVDLHGELVPIPCGLDTLFWRGTMRPAYRALARLGGARPDLLIGVALDLDSAVEQYTGAGFCDSDYREGLSALRLDSADRERFAQLPPAARYDTLLERGLLDPYFEKLEASVAERAIALRVELRRLHPDLRFAFRATRAPTDWFSLGLLRGFSTPDAPILLWLRERESRDLLQRYRERGIVALVALRLDARRVTTAEWGRLRPALFDRYDGFWLERAESDSLGRLLRRVVR